MNLLFSLLSKSHDRKGFSCGNTALDTYLQKQARQDAQRGFSIVTVAMEEEHPERIIGYYTLAAASVALDRLPEETRKTLPRYQDIPSILLGRLAVSNAFQRQHIGSLLVLMPFDARSAMSLRGRSFLFRRKMSKRSGSISDACSNRFRIRRCTCGCTEHRH